MYKTISKTIKQLRKQFNNIPTIFSCVPSTAVLKSIQLTLICSIGRIVPSMYRRSLRTGSWKGFQMVNTTPQHKSPQHKFWRVYKMTEMHRKTRGHLQHPPPSFHKRKARQSCHLGTNLRSILEEAWWTIAGPRLAAAHLTNWAIPLSWISELCTSLFAWALPTQVEPAHPTWKDGIPKLGRANASTKTW